MNKTNGRRLAGAIAILALAGVLIYSCSKLTWGEVSLNYIGPQEFTGSIVSAGNPTNYPQQTGAAEANYVTPNPFDQGHKMQRDREPGSRVMPGPGSLLCIPLHPPSNLTWRPPDSSYLLRST